MNTDLEIFNLIDLEKKRQHNSLEMVASENYTSESVRAAQGSILTNKYAEGYPNKRYYGGCEVVDKIEQIAIDRAKKLFKANWVNVQPHSGSQANQAVFLSLLKPGDTILGLDLSHGGHLTHGSKVNFSGKIYNSVFYYLDKETNLINMDSVKEIALEHKPKLIICGYSAYPREIDFERFKEIADLVDAYLLADISHISGFVASEIFKNPLEYCDVVTSTTHKTLRGPRGGIILSNNLELGKKFDKAIFPGIQGGPLEHVIAAKAVAFGEALQPSYRQYCLDVIENARILCNSLKKNGLNVVTDGTDSHIILVDLRNINKTGKEAQNLLNSIKISCNKNTVPFDDKSPFVTSGIRLGTCALTTRGLQKEDFEVIGNLIAKVLTDEFFNKNITVYTTMVQNLCEINPIR